MCRREREEGQGRSETSCCLAVRAYTYVIKGETAAAAAAELGGSSFLYCLFRLMHQEGEEEGEEEEEEDITLLSMSPMDARTRPD